MNITSYWQTETGYFDEKICRYTQREFTEIKEKELDVIIKAAKAEDKLSLHFIGGPTGFESYYLDTLIKILKEAPEDGNLTICGGTINSWPRCWVKMADLKKVLSKLFYDPYEE